MRGALLYLMLTKIKNQIKSIFKSPVKIIYMVIIIGLIAVMIFSSNTKSSWGNASFRDIRELIAGIFALFTIKFMLIAKNGFNNGASMFTMQDVNMIFTSPIDPRKVLFFGLFQQLGTSLLLGFFLLFQFSWLHNLYGIDFSVLIVILLGYGLTIFCAQFMAMIIYSFTNSNEGRKRIVKAIFYGIILLYAAGLIVYLMQDMTQVFDRLIVALNSNIIRFFPVSGWIMNAADGLISSNLKGLATGLILCALYIAGMVRLIYALKQDYYEDVLKTTEISYSAITARKSGQMGESSPQNVKIGKTGLKGGFGADAFYYKHLIENRRARVFILSSHSLIFTLCIIAFSFFVRNIGIPAIFMFATYMQLFGVALGRFPKELLKPYVYLVPESPFEKLIACMRESFSGFILEAVIVFVPVALILQLSVVDTLFCILARISFAMLFTAGNVLIGRVFGTVSSKIFVFVFYFVSLIVLCIPGIISAVLLVSFNVIILTENVTILLALTLCNIPISLLVLFLCRNILQYAELNNK